MAQSTPVRKPSSKTISDPHNPSSHRSQKELKTIVKDEIGDQSWIFPTTAISSMLSPKTPKQGVTGDGFHLLENYDCVVDREPFQNALKEATNQLQLPSWCTETKERVHCELLAKFLNNCVACGGQALSNADLRGTWYDELCFVKYDKGTGDGVGGAHPVKPDLGGGNDLVAGTNSDSTPTLYWSPRSQTPGQQMQLPVEVNDSWSEMVMQAATYARCLFSASPSRTFALVIAYQHIRRHCRFLIFHRGGLTSHRVLDLRTPSGCVEALRLIMTLLLWSTPQDAGFISTCNDFEYLVPATSDSNDEEFIKATVTEVISDSTCVRGRATRVCRLRCGPETAPEDLEPDRLQPTAQASVLRRKPQSPAVSPPPSQSRRSKQKGSASSKREEQVLADPKVASQTDEIHPHFIHPKHAMEWRRPSCLTPGKGDKRLKDGQHIVLKVSWQVDGRKNTESEMYRAADGLFGTPAIHCSYDGIHPTGEPISNHLFLPAPGATLQDFHWDLFNNKTPISVEAYTMCFTVFTLIGQSLTNAESSSELCLALIHGLLGYLSIYQTGFMHRDISIGNVLLAEKSAPKSQPAPFNIQGRMLTAVWPLPGESSGSTSVAAVLDGMTIGDADQSLAQIAQDIKEIAAKLSCKTGTECTAFVTDGDMAAEWTTYFDDEHNLRTRWGTQKFMSLHLRQSMPTNGTSYIQSPIDDIESFFWLACWAVCFNRHIPTQDRSLEEIGWQQKLSNGSYESRCGVAHGISSDAGAGKYSPITKQLLPLLDEWWVSQLALRKAWQRVNAAVDDVPTHQKAQYYLYHFHFYALRGVKDGLAVLTKYRDALQDFAPFPSK